MRLAIEVLEEHNGLFPDYIIAAMKEYDKEACEEQRRICKDQFNKNRENIISAQLLSISNAPLPELK